jgi:Ankyrin repeats (3 copies)
MGNSTSLLSKDIVYLISYNYLDRAEILRLVRVNKAFCRVLYGIPKDAVFDLSLYRLKFIELLLAKGASPNKGIYGAAEGGHLDIVQLLLEKGADPNNGIEAAASVGHIDIVQLLLAKGANPNEGIYHATHHGHLDIIDYISDTYF